jgi:hypothetical protein
MFADHRVLLPVLRTMIYVQDFDRFGLHPVDNYIGSGVRGNSLVPLRWPGQPRCGLALRDKMRL